MTAPTTASELPASVAGQSLGAAPGSAKVELRRMLRPGQKVRVCGLSRMVDGVHGIVAGMIERGVSSDSITSEGYWTIICPDGLRRDFQRRYLRNGYPSPNGELNDRRNQSES